ncbi:MAG: hypothetical protein GY851_10980 [bacterium]|nr:hypothetical protein [bacterium]
MPERVVPDDCINASPLGMASATTYEAAMKAVACPHCGNHKIVTTKVPRDVVVVVPCPACSELVVMFRGKAIALDRETVENGSFEDRKDHIAGIIAEFLEPGMFSGSLDQSSPGGFGFAAGGSEDLSEDDDEDTTPISQKELDKFVRVDLKRLDEPGYFREHFG